MSVNIKIIDRQSQSASIKLIDKNIKNRFKWIWLEEKDCSGEYFSQYIRKIEEPGIAWCLYCKEKIKYGSGGKNTIKHNVLSK